MSDKWLSYIAQLNQSGFEDEFREVYEYAVANQIPAVRPDTARLLYFLVKLARPRHILEIGTGSGYSTLWMAKGLEEGAKITTLERDKNRFDNALVLFLRYAKIELKYTDGFKFLKESTSQYDLIFLDAQKRDYIDFFPLIEKSLSSGGIFIIDNCLFGGRVVEIPDADREKYASGVARLKAFNQALSTSKAFETLVLPIDDGVIVSRKI